jgi:hypothetical protein
MREAATTLTDVLLALLSLAALLGLRRSASRGAPLFFAGFVVAATAGGLWHGYLSAAAADSVVQQSVWWFSMLGAGVSAAGLAWLGADLLGRGHDRGVRALLLVALLTYAFLAWRDPRFLLVVIATAVGMAVCAAGLLRSACTSPRAPALLALLGLMAAVGAGVAQQRGFAFRAPLIDHNATYHLLLLPSLALFYSGLQVVLAARSRTPRD